MSGKKESKTKPEAAPSAEGEGGEGVPAKKKLSGKTLILFVVLPALLVVGGGGAAAMMLMGGKKPATEEHAEADAEHGKEAAAGEHGEAPAGEHGEAAADEHGDTTGQSAAGPEEVGTLKVGTGGEPSYYDMPKILVNLSGMNGDRPLLLELELVLESQDADAFSGVPNQMPRLMDQVQTFLRELRVEDLNGSAGTYRLRLELLKRFNLVLAPSRIDAVLIEGILIQ